MQPLTTTEFDLGKVGIAAGLTITTLNKWILTGLFPSKDGEQTSRGQGKARKATYLTALSIIIMGELARRGVPLKTAAIAAKIFAYTDFVSTSAKWDSQADSMPNRGIGEVFATGLTFLVIHGDWGDLHSRIIQVDPKKPFGEVWRQCLLSTAASGATIVDLNTLFFTRVRALGMDVDHFDTEVAR